MKILFVDFTTCLETVDDLASRARGGMVSSLFHVSEALAEENHVTVMSDIGQRGYKNGVVWINQDQMEDVVEQSWDFLILNRNMLNALPEIRARHRILWTHDLVHGGFCQNPQLMKCLSGVVFMSRYAEMIWRLYYPTIGKSFMIPNGIDPEIFFHLDFAEKDMSRLIYISAPNRGLHRLGILFKGIQHKVDRELSFRAFSNMKVLHPGDKQEEDGCIPNEGERDRFGTYFPDPQECGVEVLDPVPQRQLAAELRKASLMILPTGYPEICSNAVLQSLACGTPIVTPDLGSVGEWVKSFRNGMLTKTRLEDYMVFLREIAKHAIMILNNLSLHRKMIRRAARTKILTWGEVGSKWKRMLLQLS